MEEAFDEYGVPGLSTQVAYFLINAGKWQGDEARQHKAVLKKWSSRSNAGAQVTVTAAVDPVKVTFTLTDLSDAFYEGRGEDIKGLNNMTDEEKFNYLKKKAGERYPGIRIKIGTGQFRQAVDLNMMIRKPCDYKYKLSPRVGYKLATFVVSPASTKAWTENVDTTWSPPDGFFKQTPDKIAHGLKSAHKDLTSAMGSLNFYINRAGKNLDPAAKHRLQMAKDKLASLYPEKAAFNPEYILRTNPELVQRVRNVMKDHASPAALSDTMIAIALQDLIVKHGTLALSSMPDATFKFTIHDYLDELHKVSGPGVAKQNPHPTERRKA